MSIRKLSKRVKKRTKLKSDDVILENSSTQPPIKNMNHVRRQNEIMFLKLHCVVELNKEEHSSLNKKTACVFSL